jgi:hypothetical protein
MKKIVSVNIILFIAFIMSNCDVDPEVKFDASLITGTYNESFKYYNDTTNLSGEIVPGFINPSLPFRNYTVSISEGRGGNYLISFDNRIGISLPVLELIISDAKGGFDPYLGSSYWRNIKTIGDQLYSSADDPYLGSSRLSLNTDDISLFLHLKSNDLDDLHFITINATKYR